MRKLTIKRNKSFVGCINKAKVYIEDASSSELVINGIPCRKLGNLKNNEEKTFEIGNEEAKVFVITDKFTKELYNDCYQLSVGEEDVYLSGQNRFNLANGNAFEFDNGNVTERMYGRKKNSKKGLAVLIVSIIIGALVGFAVSYYFHSGPKVEPKEFNDDCLNITLTNEFVKTEAENFTVGYGSEKVAVLALKEDFTLLEGFSDYTVEEYANLVLEKNGLTSTQLKKDDGLIGFEYDRDIPDKNKTFRYFAYVYKAEDAFWLIHFATETKYAVDFEAKITEWAKSVYFCYCFE